MDTNNKNGAQIDFSGYSLDQLRYLESSINRETHPDDYRGLVAEIARRESVREREEGTEYPVRFTPFGSILGWTISLYRRSPLYANGAIRFEADEIVLRGRQRTWLGVPVWSELRIDSRHVRNAVHQNRYVSFEVHADGERRKLIRFQVDGPDSAEAILVKLPQRRTEKFDAHWTQLRDYQEAIQLRTPRPWATPVLIGLNVLVFVIFTLASHNFVSLDAASLTSRGANTGLFTLSGQWWRLVTALFLHGGFLHLFFNMWALWGAGRLAERLYGTATFLFLYFASGIVASLSTLAWNPAISSIGASGAIFGILGACIVFLLRRDVHVPRTVIRAQGLSTAGFVIFSLFSGFTSTNVDNAAHVGGLLAGCLFGWILTRPLNAHEHQSFRAAQLLMATMAVCIISTASVLQFKAIRASQSAPERFWASHQWFLEGQARALRAAAELQAGTQRGEFSSTEVIRRLEKDIVPFWKEADERLQVEPDSPDPELQKFAALVTSFVGHRRDAVEASLDAVRTEDRDRILDAASSAESADIALASVTRLGLRPQSNRFHSLSGSSYVKALRNFVTRMTWRCVLPQAKHMAADWQAYANDGTAGRVAGGCAAQRAFETGEYVALDAMLHPADGSVADLVDGGSQLSGVVGGLDDLFNHYGNIDAPLSRLTDWRSQRPQSDGPDMVETIVFRSWAWSARGHGLRETVSPQGWMLFAQRLEMAAAALKDAEQNATPNPVKYELSMAMDLERNRDPKKIRSTFDIAVTRYPDYYPLYSSMVRTLLPRWGGSFREEDDFFDEAILKNGAERASEMYARLYGMFTEQEGDETVLFSDTYARWPRMKQGFDAMVERHPKSEAIRNSYAAFACRAKDMETYRKTRESIHRIDENVWTEAFSVEKCDKLLQDGAAPGT